MLNSVFIMHLTKKSLILWFLVHLVIDAFFVTRELIFFMSTKDIT